MFRALATTATTTTTTPTTTTTTTAAAPTYNTTAVNLATASWVPTWNKVNTANFTQSTPYNF